MFSLIGYFDFQPRLIFYHCCWFFSLARFSRCKPYNRKTTKNVKAPKVTKISSQLKIEIPYQKERNKWLKLAYLVWTLISSLLGVEGLKRGQNRILATSAPFFTVFRGLQAKMNAPIVFRHKNL